MDDPDPEKYEIIEVKTLSELSKLVNEAAANNPEDLSELLDEMDAETIADMEKGAAFCGMTNPAYFRFLVANCRDSMMECDQCGWKWRGLYFTFSRQIKCPVCQHRNDPPENP